MAFIFILVLVLVFYYYTCCNQNYQFTNVSTVPDYNTQKYSDYDHYSNLIFGKLNYKFKKNNLL